MSLFSRVVALKLFILFFAIIISSDYFCLSLLKHIPVFHPTAFKGCLGYCFHPWCPDGRSGILVGGCREKVCPGCILEPVRCRKLILGSDKVGGVSMQHHGVTLI